MVERDLGQFLGAKPIVDLNCLDLRSFPPEFLFLFSLSEAERGFGAIFRCGADCRSKLPTPQMKLPSQCSNFGHLSRKRVLKRV